MHTVNKISSLLIILFLSFRGFAQFDFNKLKGGDPKEVYAKAAKLCEEAAQKYDALGCPESAAYCRKIRDWNNCMLQNLANPGSCGLQPLLENAPKCGAANTAGNGTPGNSSSVNNNYSSDELANSIEGLVSGISELSKMKLDKNSEAESWYLLSAGVNLDGNAGPIAGTTADIGNPAGYFFDASALSRKGISILGSFTSLKSKYFHSFRAKGQDGVYRQYIGTTHVEMPVLAFSLGKDMTGVTGAFHFVPNVGADLVFDINNDFVSKNFAGVAYTEEWDKNLFFAIHAGVQMFYLFSKRFGLQGGIKYLYFPSESGSVFKTNGFFHLDAGIAVRLM